MPIYNNEIVFLHIPRTCGTQIENTLKKQNFSVTCYGPSTNGFSKQHYTMDKLNTYINNDVFKFTFVRNPFDRILSSYLIWAINHTPNFDEYINMVKNVVENKLYFTKVTINTIDLSHFIPMTEMIGNNTLDFIGKFENFNNDIKQLAKMCPKLFLCERIVIKKRNVDYKKYYNDRNRKIIEKLYEEDLKQFKYTF